MTPFSQIYKLALSLLDKNERIENMDLDIKLDMFSDLITMCGTVDFTQCKVDLSKFTPYTQQIISEKLLIGMQSIDIEIPENVELIDYEDIIVMCNGLEVREAIVEVQLNDRNINISYGDMILDDYEFQDDDQIDIIFYKDGYFHEELSAREKSILAYGTMLKLINQEVAKEDRIKENLSDKDYSISGRWQTLNSLLEMQSSLQTQFDKYLKEYTYSVSITIEDLL